MKLNRLEFIAMNNPIRAFVQEHYELPILRAMAEKADINTALEIGCGNGNGSRLIQKYFKPQKLYSVDLDEKMISIARRKNSGPAIEFSVMDASKLNFPDAHFDAIFDFGIIHHIPNWRDCVNELYRVLKKDGELIIEDLSIESFRSFPGALWRALSTHPYKEMFTQEEFTDYLKTTGFVIKHLKRSNPMGLIKLFSLTARKM